MTLNYFGNISVSWVSQMTGGLQFLGTLHYPTELCQLIKLL